jgi:hypothetical protein
MKFILSIFIAYSINVFASGSAFYTDINGVRYYCSPTDSQPDDGIHQPGFGNTYDCIEKAYAGPFSRSEAEDLCTGAYSTSPADCAREAYAGVFSKDESIELCRGVSSVGPAICARKAYAGPFSKSESLDLCDSSSATEETANCALRAYAGPYSKEEAIKICKYSLNAALKTLSLIENSPEAKALTVKSKTNKILENVEFSAIKIKELNEKEIQKLLDFNQ